MHNEPHAGLPRRQFMRTTAGAAAGCLLAGAPTTPLAAAALDDRIAGVTRQTIFRGSLGSNGKPLGKTWFSTRCGMIPGDQRNGGDAQATALMLMAEISGSDYFGPVHETLSHDLGQTWSTPTPVPGLGRTPLNDGQGTEAAVCDMVPEFHERTGTVLAMGHDVFYRGPKFSAAQPPRHAMYIVRRRDGSWSSLRRLIWDDPRGAYIYTCNCAQRIHLPDGDVLTPLSVGATSAARSVVVVRCAFDGDTLTVRETSNELKNHVGRGLLEPSLATCGGKFYLTIRAENGRGYVSTATDPLRWSIPVEWKFDDDEQPIGMSSTQQRWMVHNEVLYLVYTRRDATNEQVMRWRAPLFTARVDLETLRLVRSTERVVVPLVGDGVNAGKHVPHLGNFHVNRATDNESWLTVGDYSAVTFRGDVTLARVRWS